MSKGYYACRCGDQVKVTRFSVSNPKAALESLFTDELKAGIQCEWKYLGTKASVVQNAKLRQHQMTSTHGWKVYADETGN